MRPAILVLLREEEGHGYAIIERLFDLGLTGTDSGGMYRALRALEEEGAVRSWWADAERGAPRRVYAITGIGRRQLTRALDGLERQRAMLDEIVDRGKAEVAPREHRRGPVSPTSRHVLRLA